MKPRILFASLLLLFAMVSGEIVGAQDDIEVQDFVGVLEGIKPNIVYFDIFDAVAGETLYIYAESSEFDPYIAICDIDCVEIFAENDDISQENTNSALEFTFPSDGDYSIMVTDCCDEEATGEFWLLLGYGAPDVLSGNSLPNGAQIAIPYDPAFDATVEAPVPMTGDPEIQEFNASISTEIQWSYFDLLGMLAGETIYVYAESDQIDPQVFVCDLDCEETFAENDDIDADNSNFNSALYFTFPADGDYSIAIADCCDENAAGDFHLVIGFNAPEVLTGDAIATGAFIAVPYEPTYIPVMTSGADGSVQTQEFVGEIEGETQYLYYDILDAVAGETLYIYAESNELDTYLAVCDIECLEIFAENDDISQRNTNSAIEFTFPADGDYSIAVYDCCDEAASGSFRLILGYNAPEVLDGIGIPNGAEIAQLYEPVPVTVAAVERTPATNCANIELSVRPELSGPMQTVGTDNFLIHYTTEGKDAATEEYVANVLAFVDLVLEVQTQQLHWPLPPQDCGEGGDSRFDLYLAETLDQGTLGYAQPENIVGDNPNSPASEVWASYSYMVVDNDMRGVSAPLSVMRATIAHEFHHTIQFGYDASDPATWFYEATASWIETLTSPADQDATGYTQAVLSQPSLCIGTQEEDTGVRIYGEWLLIDSLAQDFGNDAIIRLWESIADFEGMEDFYQFLEALGSTPQEALRNYAVRNLLRAYQLGAVLPATVSVAGVINGTGTIVSDFNGVQEMSAEYVLIRRRGNYTFSIIGNNLSLAVVGIDRGTNQAQVFDLGRNGTVDTSTFDNAYVIVLNNNIQSVDTACSTTDWELTILDGTGASPMSANSEIFDASNFAATR